MIIQKDRPYTKNELQKLKIIPSKTFRNKAMDYFSLLKVISDPDPIKGLHAIKIDKGKQIFHQIQGSEIIRYIKDNAPEYLVSEDETTATIEIRPGL